MELQPFCLIVLSTGECRCRQYPTAAADTACNRDITTDPNSRLRRLQNTVVEDEPSVFQTRSDAER
jgi:hypothetical protein